MWWIMPIFVALSTFGGVNGVLLTTSRCVLDPKVHLGVLTWHPVPPSRIFFVAAQERQMPQLLSMIQTSYLTPMPSVIFVVSANRGRRGLVSAKLLIVTEETITTLLFSCFHSFPGINLSLDWKRTTRFSSNGITWCYGTPVLLRTVDILHETSVGFSSTLP